MKTFNIYIDKAYWIIFRNKINGHSLFFLKNIFYITIGVIPSTILSLIFMILAGRILGPVEYGKFLLLQSVAMFLYLPMLLGFNTAMIKYASENEDIDRQKRIISTTYILTIIFTIVSVVFFYVLSTEISTIFSVSTDFIHLSIIFAFLYVFYIITTNTLRAIFNMKMFSVYQILYSFILLISFITFIYSGFKTFNIMVYSMFIAYGFTSIMILIYSLRKYFKLIFDLNWAYILLNYSVYCLIGGICYTIYTNIDKILINRYMTTADVGIYGAYSIASMNLVLLFYGIFITVFFPSASRYKNKNDIFQYVNKSIPYIIVIALPIIIISEYIILYMYGSGYIFNFYLAILFGISGIVACINGVYSWLMNAIGIKGVKVTSIAGVILALLCLILDILLIPLMGIEGAVVSMIVSYLASTIYIISKKGYLSG